MHGVELVGFDLDASSRQFTLERDRLDTVLGKLRLERLFLDARHWQAIFWRPNSPRASYRPQGCVLNGGNPRSRCESGAAPSAVLRAAIRAYGFRGERRGRAYDFGRWLAGSRDLQSPPS